MFCSKTLEIMCLQNILEGDYTENSFKIFVFYQKIVFLKSLTKICILHLMNFRNNILKKILWIGI